MQIIQVRFFFLTLILILGRATSVGHGSGVLGNLHLLWAHRFPLWNLCDHIELITDWQHAKIPTEILTCWICCSLNVRLQNIQYAKIRYQCVTDSYAIYSNFIDTLMKRFPNSLSQIKT